MSLRLLGPEHRNVPAAMPNAHSHPQFAWQQPGCRAAAAAEFDYL